MLLGTNEMDLFSPIIGSGLSIGLHLSTLPKTREIIRQETMNGYDPIPIVYLWCNCVGSLAYSFLLQVPESYYVFSSNFTGTVLNLLSILYFLHLSVIDKRKRMIQILLGFTMTFPIASYVSVFHASIDTAKWIMGSFANLLLVLFYLSQVSITIQLIKTRNSQLLYFPMILFSFMSSAFTLYFGISVQDFIIIISQSLGVIVGVFQLLSIMITRFRNRNFYQNINR